MTISKTNSQYKVKSKSGRTLGTHKTKKKAVKQLQAIEISKHRKQSKYDKAYKKATKGG